MAVLGRREKGTSEKAALSQVSQVVKRENSGEFQERTDKRKENSRTLTEDLRGFQSRSAEGRT